jgi:hypothetical protein
VQEELLAKPIYRESDHVLIPPAVMRRTLAEVRRERLAVYRRHEAQHTQAVVAVAADHYIARPGRPASAVEDLPVDEQNPVLAHRCLLGCVTHK